MPCSWLTGPFRNPEQALPVDHDTGHALETVVLHELQHRGAEVAYVRTTGGFDVDFLARYPGGSEALIQVCAGRATGYADARQCSTAPGHRLGYLKPTGQPFDSVP